MHHHGVVRRAATTAALGAVVAALCAFGTAQASADTSLGNRTAAIAEANLGKTACSANSTGQGGVPNAADGFGTSCSGEEWCADFAKWSWNQAGYTDTADISAAAYTFARHGATNGTFHWIYDTGYTPQPGDAAVWMGNNVTLSSTTDASELDFDDVQHVDLVYSVTSRADITTVGGNEGGKVSEMTFDPTNSVINGGGGQNWGQSVIGYISPGAPTSPPPAGFTVTLDANGAPIAAGQNLSGTVNLTAVASAQGYIYGLDYTITGPNYSTTINGGSGADNYAQPWNTSGLASGAYTIKATADETDGQAHTYGPISVIVSNNLSNSGGLAATAGGGFTIAWQGRDANNSLWVTSGTGSSLNPANDPWALGVAAGTTPAMATLGDGSWVAAWQGRDANHSLWIATGHGNSITWDGDPYAYGVADGSSPAIIALPNNGYEVAWQGRDTNNSLWVTNGTGSTLNPAHDPYAYGVATGTSPSVAPLPGGNFEVAWQGRDTNNSLWVTSGTGSALNPANDPWAYGVAAGTSPSLAPLPGGSFEVAWQGRDANNSLWVTNGTGSTLNPAHDPYAYGVATGTSPSVAPLPGGNFEVAWQGRDANNSLWVTTGSGSALNPAKDPWAYGVATAHSPSLVTYADGTFEVAWKGRDANGSLWVTSGTGSSLNPAHDPYAYGVA